MSIEIEPYTEDAREEWESFVDEAPNGTLFHRRAFLDYHPPTRFDIHPLLFYYKGQNLLGVMPLAYSEDSDGNVIAQSPYGGSYGGIVLEEGCKFRYVGRMVESMIEYLKGEGVDRIRIRPTPREQCRTQSCYQEFHLVDNGFEITDHEVTNVIDCARFESDPFDVYEGRCRRAVRKARKEDVEIRANVDKWETFHNILTETLARHDKTPTHTLDDLQELADRVPERIRLSLAYHDGTAIAGTMSFLLNETTDFLFYNCHKNNYRKYNPVNLLIDNELRWANEAGYQYVDQGTSVENHEWNDGLIKFKESFGAGGHFRTVYTRDV